MYVVYKIAEMRLRVGISLNFSRHRSWHCARFNNSDQNRCKYMYKHSYLRLSKAAPGPHIVPDGRLLAAAHLRALFRPRHQVQEWGVLLANIRDSRLAQSSAQQVASVCDASRVYVCVQNEREGGRRKPSSRATWPATHSLH